MKRSHLLLALAMTLTAGALAHAQEMVGAQKLIHEVRNYKPDPSDTSAPVDPEQAWQGKVKALAAKVDTLGAQDATEQWLALYDRMFELKSARGYRSGEQEGLVVLMKALPGPEAWPALMAEADKREVKGGMKAYRTLGLRFLAHLLNSDDAGLMKDVVAMKQLEGKVSTQRGGAYMVSHQVESLNDLVLKRSTQGPLAEFEAGLVPGPRTARYSSGLRVPNLIDLVGEEKARELLRKALGGSQQLEFGQNNQTVALAREMAIKEPAILKRAQWGLVGSLDSVGLFEQMDARFPAKPVTGSRSLFSMGSSNIGAENDYAAMQNRERAIDWYTVGLVSQSRYDDALAFLKKNKKKQSHWNNYDLLSPKPGLLEEEADPEKVFTFFDKLTQAGEPYPVWERFILAGARVGKTDVPIQRLQAYLAKPGLDAKASGAAREQLISAYLSGGKVDEAVAMMIEDLSPKPEGAAKAQAQAKPAPQEEANVAKGGKEIPEIQDIDEVEMGMMVSMDDRASEPWTRALRLLRVVEISGSPELKARVVGICKSVLAGAPKGARIDDLLTVLVWHEVRQGRAWAGEELVKKELIKATHKGEEEEVGRRGFHEQESRAPMLLLLLAEIYHHAGRHQDVLNLLNEAPWWGAGDLAQVSVGGWSVGGGHGAELGDSSTPSLKIIAATALAKTGRPEEARKIVYRVLEESPGMDAAYALLYQIDGAKMTGKLDEVMARERFEERPLIWKAQVLLDEGKAGGGPEKLAAAEKLARQAIAIDPSDGEQGHGKRMRVYAVLCDILKAQGNTKDAEIFEGVIKAIRLAEKADDVYASGLKGQAIKMYRESLDMFSDAYCIQSRLAVQLMEAGRPEEARVHYQKAFELMPDSFGRVESHCFGCEGVFQGEVAQGMAEKVFSQLVKKTPDKPQVHYLLGYLRESQQREKEALALFEQAVKLDGDYLNAWIKIQRISSNGGMGARDLAEKATLNILRLDPYGRVSPPDFNGVSNLKALWAALLPLEKLRTPAGKTLYPLAASASVPMSQERMMWSVGYTRETSLAPRDVIASLRAVHSVGSLLATSMMTED